MDQLERIHKLEIQVDRLVSDAESEKDTRKRRNEAIDLKQQEYALKIDRLENVNAIMSRALWILFTAVVSLVIYLIRDYLAP